MKKFITTAVLATAVASQGFAQKCAEAGECKGVDAKVCEYMPKVCKVKGDALKTFGDKLSYAFGRSMAQQLKRMPGDINPNIDGEINPDLVVTGLIHSVSGADALLSEDEVREIMTEFQQKMQAAQGKKMKDMQAKQASGGSGALEEGIKFLEENKKKEGVVVTASGLQYKVLTAAEGDKPAAANTVEVHYHGTTIDGNVFDSSVDRGEKISFPLNGVIKGWTEGVQLMSIGSKYRFFIPSELAYGTRGAGAAIPPNATLIFDVELFSIK